VTRWIAVLTLLVLAVALVAPVVAPATAFAATSDPGTANLPPIPWAQVWNAIKAWGPILIYLVDTVITALTGGGGGGAPNPPPPPPPPSDPSIVTPVQGHNPPVAWCGTRGAAGACA